jgi:hypothetical protein
MKRGRSVSATCSAAALLRTTVRPRLRQHRSNGHGSTYGHDHHKQRRRTCTTTPSRHAEEFNLESALDGSEGRGAQPLGEDGEPHGRDSAGACSPRGPVRTRSRSGWRSHTGRAGTPKPARPHCLLHTTRPDVRPRPAPSKFPIRQFDNLLGVKQWPAAVNHAILAAQRVLNVRGRPPTTATVRPGCHSLFHPPGTALKASAEADHGTGNPHLLLARELADRREHQLGERMSQASVSLI